MKKIRNLRLSALTAITTIAASATIITGCSTGSATSISTAPVDTNVTGFTCSAESSTSTVYISLTSSDLTSAGCVRMITGLTSSTIRMGVTWTEANSSPGSTFTRLCSATATGTRGTARVDVYTSDGAVYASTLCDEIGQGGD